MKQQIIAVMLFSFLIMSVVSFEDAFAHSNSLNHIDPHIQPLLILDQNIYNVNETINATCINNDPSPVSKISWSIKGYDTQITPTTSHSFLASDLGVGQHTIKCHIVFTDIIHQGVASAYFSIVADTIPDSVTVVTEPSTPQEPNKNDGNGGCPDCTPPTVGVDNNGNRLVDFGAVLNGEKFQLGNFKTHTPMMFTEIGQENHLAIKMYENHGSYNIDFLQFGLVKEIGDSMNIFEPRIEIDLANTSNDIHNPLLEGIKIFDKQGIIENAFVRPSLVDCMEGFTHECLQLDIYWTFAKVPENKVIAFGGWDNGKSPFVHYLNDGITVIDPNYVEPVPEEPYKSECVTPEVLPMNGGTRNDCWWRAMHMGWLWN